MLLRLLSPENAGRVTVDLCENCIDLFSGRNPFVFVPPAVPVGAIRGPFPGLLVIADLRNRQRSPLRHIRAPRCPLLEDRGLQLPSLFNVRLIQVGLTQY